LATREGPRDVIGTYENFWISNYLFIKKRKYTKLYRIFRDLDYLCSTICRRVVVECWLRSHCNGFRGP